jgi:hypothetical protein
MMPRPSHRKRREPCAAPFNFTIFFILSLGLIAAASAQSGSLQDLIAQNEQRLAQARSSQNKVAEAAHTPICISPTKHWTTPIRRCPSFAKPAAAAAKRGFTAC